MIHLPQVTLICIDTVNHGPAIMAIKKTLEQITPARTIFFTDIDIQDDQFDVIKIQPLRSKDDYSHWMVKELGKYTSYLMEGKQAIDTTYILVIQHDGYVIDSSCWTYEFLEYDYIGALWPFEQDGLRNGNGGFSLRSTRLHVILTEDPLLIAASPEDAVISRTYRSYLESKYNLSWAPDHLCEQFSYECGVPKNKTFGFHGKFHLPYQPYICIKREGALGDVIQVEPILAYYYSKGYNVILDSPYYEFFKMHFFPVYDYRSFDKSIPHQIINLDSSYEAKPKQLHLNSYFETCGASDFVLRNPELNYQVQDSTRIFKKYVVLHIDNRDTTHRNIFGVNWKDIVKSIEDRGYTVIQIGKAEHESVALEFNTVNHGMLLWLIAGCDFFVGVDSGPSHIAVALGKPCVLFFGSVKPEYIHADLSDIEVIQAACPVKKDGCWHDTLGYRGKDCEVNVTTPPCCVSTNATVWYSIAKVMHKLFKNEARTA
jgi:hypothetical protein